MKPATQQIDSLLSQAAAMLNEGKLQEARSICQWVLQENPKNVAALYLTALLASTTGRDDMAERMLLRAVEIKPNYVDAHFTLGTIYQKQKRYSDAGKHYRSVTTYQTGHYGAWNNLGTCLREQQNETAGIEAYRRAVELKPDFAEGWDNLGNLLMIDGQKEEAVKAFNHAIKENPHYTQSWRHLSIVYKWQEKDRPRLAQLEAIANTESLSSLERDNAFFALGKAYDNLREYDRSFGFYSKAQKLLRQKHPFDIHAIAALFSDIRKEVQQLKERQTIGKCGNPSNLPVFILGLPRSGTTLVEQIIASHPEVKACGELPTLFKLLHEGNGKPEPSFPHFLNTITPEQLTQLGQRYVEQVGQDLPDGCQRITDKMPGNFRFLGLIPFILPNARIIHCQRNPLDIAVSMMRTRFTESHHYVHDQETLGKYIKLYQYQMKFWHEYFGDRIHTVVYENIIEDMETEARALISHCGLEWDNSCLSFHKTHRLVHTASVNQVRTPLYNSSVNSWKRYEKHLSPLLSQLESAD